MKKKLLLLISISIFFSVLLFGYSIMKSTGDVQKFTFLKSIFPDKTKRFLKENIIYFQYQDLAAQSTRLRENFIKVNKKRVANWRLISEEYIDQIDLNLIRISANQRIVTEKNIKYELDKYIIPFFDLDYYEWEQKPIGYIDQTEENLFFVTGNGQIFYFNKRYIPQDKVPLNNIKSNLKEIILDIKFFNNDRISVKDILIKDNYFYLSYTREVQKDCYNTSIIRAQIDLNYLKFEDFFVYDECVPLSYREWNAHQVGGALFGSKDKIYLSIGEFRDRKRAQDKNSIMGKNVAIDIQSREYSVISMGHRNVQGMFYDNEKDVMVMSEHGPRGGDEININKGLNKNITAKNYGWPISSYGEHYNKKFERPDSPLHKSHSEYGFIEPIKYWDISIGVGTIAKIPTNYNSIFKKNDYLIGSMGWILSQGHRSIHHISFDKNYESIIQEDIIQIDERVRDISIDGKNKLIYLVLENSPGIGVLKVK